MDLTFAADYHRESHAESLRRFGAEEEAAAFGDGGAFRGTIGAVNVSANAKLAIKVSYHYGKYFFHNTTSSY